MYDLKKQQEDELKLVWAEALVDDLAEQMNEMLTPVDPFEDAGAKAADVMISKTKVNV